ncbi:MAG: hypothetical protein ACFB50_08330 [Rubrobacteraceae bacterium]
MQTHDPTPRDAPRYSDNQGLRYDTDLMKSEAERLLSAYLGQSGNRSGARSIWSCPRCGKQDKLSLQRATGAVGCWNAGCEVPDGTDVVGLIAHLEGLQTRGEDFKRVAALCYDLLDLPAPTPPKDNPDGVAPVLAPTDKDSSNGHREGRFPKPSEQATDSLPALSPEQSLEAVEKTDRVLGRLLELCPLEERDERFLASRGVALATAQAGRFGSISAERAVHVIGRLEREFGREVLLDVPGFREDERQGNRNGGRLGWTLWGDFLLIPYLDPEGRVVTVEGRAVGEVPRWAGKYTSLRNGGNHLYVFPGFRPEDVRAFVEGPLGPVVAAQEGIPVGGIQGVKRYTAAGGRAPLPELAGVDFGGRGLIYVPDADVKPEAIADVEKHAPKACEWLISHQNGVPRIATVPEIVAGDEAALKDLDEWILSAPETGYYGVLRTLYSRSAAPAEWRGVDRTEATQKAEAITEEVAPDEESDKSEQLDRGVSPDQAIARSPRENGAETSDDRWEDRGESHGAAGDKSGEQSAEEELAGEQRADDGAAEEEPEPSVGPAADNLDGLDAFDRWHAVAEGRSGARAIIAKPRAYRGDIEAEDGIVPPRELVTDRELEWAGLLGTAAALALWYFLGACIGWLPGPFGWLPDPPDPVALLGGIPASLMAGMFVGVVALLHLRGRRLANRRHLLGNSK